MDSQTLLLVDNHNNFKGYASRAECHTDKGRRHRAFVTLLINSKGEVLLQKRKHRLFDNLWDLTAISHPLHLGNHDESFQEASDRALLKEMGIGHVPVREVGAFNYFAKDGENCENEHCAVLFGTYDGKYRPNKEEVYEVAQVKLEDFLGDLVKNPQKYTPWAILAKNSLENADALDQDLAAFLKAFEPYRKQFFRDKIKSSTKYSKQIADVYRELEEFSAGGKKLRGYLVWLGYQVAHGHDLFKILPMSLAFEMAHAFFLVHDDFMDRSTKRHGKQTVHKVYEKKFGAHFGESMAVLAGDIACIEAFSQIKYSSFREDKKIAFEEEFENVLLETAYGQGLDLLSAYQKPNLAQIWQIADLKAARYSVVGPLMAGAKLGVVGDKQARALIDFGLACGLAFQIKDDILGVFGNEEVLGKSVLSDMQEGKNTILIYKTREMAGKQDVLKLDRVWGNPKSGKADLAIVRSIIEKSGALDWCEKENRNLAAEAKKSIDEITGNQDLRMIFGQIADFVIGRNK